jgi:hypothetical protein
MLALVALGTLALVCILGLQWHESRTRAQRMVQRLPTPTTEALTALAEAGQVVVVEGELQPQSPDDAGANLATHYPRHCAGVDYPHRDARATVTGRMQIRTERGNVALDQAPHVVLGSTESRRRQKGRPKHVRRLKKAARELRSRACYRPDPQTRRLR